ncbi:MAG TPA: amidohydrolase family protein [Woeseiaceae bacterium]|nr:amidohydrolase family protein [Woeseiaceae bacterium]
MTDEDATRDAWLLDTHQHLVFPSRFRYSWTDSVPALKDRAFTPADYWRLADPGGIRAALFMETGVDDPFWQDETRHLVKLAADPANRIAGIVAGCRPEDDPERFDQWLEELADAPVAGFRRILHTEPDELSTSAAFARNVRELGRRGKSFDLCFLERQLPLAVELAAQCDGTTLVLDHCGVPDIAGGRPESWRRHIRELARMPHVCCKISGVVAYCPPGVTLEPAIRPYVEYCVEQFGPDRLVWGSDWPVCNITSGVADWTAMFRRLVASESPDTQRAIFRDNALRLYGVDGHRIAAPRTADA